LAQELFVSVQHLADNDFALESISGSSPGVVSLPLINTRSPVDPISGGVIGDNVFERESELPTEDTNCACRKIVPRREVIAAGTREGSEVEAVDRCGFAASTSLLIRYNHGY